MKNQYDSVGMCWSPAEQLASVRDDCKMATQKTNKRNVDLGDPPTVARAFYVCIIKKVLKNTVGCHHHVDIATIRWRNWVIR